MEPIALLYALLPFVTSIAFKTLSYVKSGEAQKKAVKALIASRTPPAGVTPPTDKQIEAILGVAGFATRSMTAATTLGASLLALLIVALKYRYRPVWGLFLADVVLAIFVWLRIHRHRGTWEDLLTLRPGEFAVWGSFLVDVVGVTASIVGSMLAGK